MLYIKEFLCQDNFQELFEMHFLTGARSTEDILELTPDKSIEGPDIDNNPKLKGFLAIEPKKDPTPDEIKIARQ